MKLSYLVKGLPGHPLHPPLTDITIGTYTFATVAAILDLANLVQRNAAYATGAFLAAVLVGHHGYTQGTVSGGAFALTLVGFVLLTTGGWLGGAVVFVHGMRVLNLVSERFGNAAAPMPKEPARIE